MTPLDYTAPFVGGLLLEALHWYQLREHLETKRYKKVLRSPAYWGTLAVTVTLCSLATLIYFQDRLSGPELLVAGGAFPTLFKKLVAGFTDKETSKLGAAEDRQIIRDYFSVA